MRVLVVGRNAELLAQAAGTFTRDLKMHTATTQAAALAVLQGGELDLVIACETLVDGSGLDVLRHVMTNTPNTLRIYAARPATLSLLQGELGVYGLFRTLPYPIKFRNLWAAINLAHSIWVATQPGAPDPIIAPAPPTPAPSQPTPTSTRIPESEAFKQARARRAAARLESRVSDAPLVQLPQLVASGRLARLPLRLPAAQKRTALFVGSGVLAATTAAVLTFFMVNASDSEERPSSTGVTSSVRSPVSTVPTLQAVSQQTSRQAALVATGSSTAGAVRGEAAAARDISAGDAGQSGPATPEVPPPSEPPTLDSPQQSAE